MDREIIFKYFKLIVENPQKVIALVVFVITPIMGNVWQYNENEKKVEETVNAANQSIQAIVMANVQPADKSLSARVKRIEAVIKRWHP